MVTKETVAGAARDFLKAVAEVAKARLGPRPEHSQRSQWMVRTGPGSLSSKECKRKVFDRASVSRVYQAEMMEADFLEQRRLKTILTAAGVPAEQTWYGFFLPLVNHWLELPAPFEFQEIAISQVLDEFVTAVIDAQVVERSLDAIVSLDLASGCVVLEKGVSIRTVTEEELWQFGTIDPFSLHRSFQRIPSEKWNILDIEVEYSRDKESEVVGTIRRSALVALRLARAGSLQVVPLGQVRNYGMGATGRVIIGGPMARELGQWGGSYVLDAKVAQRLKDSWPRLREIMGAQDHYLRLPAQRLVDGGGRDRMDDAIIDYAIGLEALLTEGIQDELRYRLALRGATVLACQGGNRQQLFDGLRDFYDVRSSIVHGGRVTQTKLSNARSQGEKALRDVWWWYFTKGLCQLKEASSIIDSRILG